MRIYLFKKRMITGIGVILPVLFFAFLLVYYYGNFESASAPAQAIYQGNSGQKVVALCINVDWGEEYLPDMLKEFKKHKVQVNFFVTGKWAENNPELLKQMSEAEHSIQNHGYKHLHFNDLSSTQAQEQILKTEKIIEQLTGEKTVYFAPPYGEYNKDLVAATEAINYCLIMWSIDTIDWQLPSADTIVKRIMNKLHNDAIILMHPTQPTLEALPDLLTQLEKEGYKPQTLDKLIITEAVNEDKEE